MGKTPPDTWGKLHCVQKRAGESDIGMNKVVEVKWCEKMVLASQIHNTGTQDVVEVIIEAERGRMQPN